MTLNAVTAGAHIPPTLLPDDDGVAERRLAVSINLLAINGV